MLKNKLLVFVGITFLLVDLIFLGVGIYLTYDAYKFTHTARTAVGIVTAIPFHSSSDGDSGGVYYPVIEFTADNGQAVEYHSTSGSNPPEFRVGEKVNIFYDPADPQNAKIDSFLDLWFIGVIFSGIGLVGVIIGSVILLLQFKKSRNKKWLLQYGQPVQAIINQVILNESLKYNGQSPFQIIAQWQNPIDGNVYIFKSDNIWFKPESVAVGDKISVLIDPVNPGKYFIDLSFLPQAAN